MKPIVTYPDFEKLEIRVGEILQALNPDWSTKLIEFKVDFGSEIGEKIIFSGIRKWYKSENLVGKLYPFLVNLAEKKMGESVSQGMMLMADEEIDGVENPILIEISPSVKPGTVIR